MAGLHCNYCEEKIPYRTRSKKRLKEPSITSPNCYKENELDNDMFKLAKLIYRVAISFMLTALIYDFMRNFTFDPLFTFLLSLISVIVYSLLAILFFRIKSV